MKAKPMNWYEDLRRRPLNKFKFGNPNGPWKLRMPIIFEEFSFRSWRWSGKTYWPMPNHVEEKGKLVVDKMNINIFWNQGHRSVSYVSWIQFQEFKTKQKRPPRIHSMGILRNFNFDLSRTQWLICLRAFEKSFPGRCQLNVQRTEKKKEKTIVILFIVINLSLINFLFTSATANTNGNSNFPRVENVEFVIFHRLTALCGHDKLYSKWNDWA